MAWVNWELCYDRQDKPLSTLNERKLITPVYLILASMNLPHLHPLKAVNCCLNSRLVVDEDDLKWVANEKNISCLLEQFHEHFRSKPHRFQEI